MQGEEIYLPKAEKGSVYMWLYVGGVVVEGISLYMFCCKEKLAAAGKGEKGLKFYSYNRNHAIQ